MVVNLLCQFLFENYIMHCTALNLFPKQLSNLMKWINPYLIWNNLALELLVCSKGSRVMDVSTFTLGTGDSIPSLRGVPELHEGLHEGPGGLGAWRWWMFSLSTSSQLWTSWEQWWIVLDMWELQTAANVKYVGECTLQEHDQGVH